MARSYRPDATRPEKLSGRELPMGGAAAQRRLFIALGNVPPPLTGKTLVTEEIFSRLARLAQPEVHVLAYQLPDGRLRRLASKLKAHGSAFAQTLAARRSGCSVRVYLVADSGSGVFITALFATALRALGAELLIHHHGFRWIERRSPWLGASLFRCGATHVTQCATMSARLRASYPGAETYSLSNAFLVDAQDLSTAREPRTEFVLAHLSNLTLEKGLARVVETYEALRSEGLAVRLRLGGLPTDEPAREALASALLRNPEIDYWGQVSADRKGAFFQDVHAFLFPSLYRIESQAIVTLEAMAFGVPVVAFPRCCIAESLAHGGGVVVEETESFSERAAEIISKWVENPVSYAAARKAAAARYETLRAESLRELERFVHHVAD